MFQLMLYASCSYLFIITMFIIAVHTVFLHHKLNLNLIKTVF
jgi:hypothetical protein